MRGILDYLVQRVWAPHDQDRFDPPVPEVTTADHLDEQLAQARAKNVDSTLGVLAASERSINDADLVRRTVRGVLHRTHGADLKGDPDA